ncbi:hypothetical protein ACLMJK_003014 [Lecanora helva]
MAKTLSNEQNLYKTTILVANVHCASCVSYIDRVLNSAFHDALQFIETNIVSHEIVIYHDRSISAFSLCRTLSDAAFEIYSATTFNQRGEKVQELGDNKSGDGWLEAATELWWPSHRASSSGQDLHRSRRSKHMENCEACRKSSPPEETPDLSTSKLLDHGFSAITRSSKESDSVDIGEKSDSRPSSPNKDSKSTPNTFSGLSATTKHEATLSIGGMTCASCTSAIDHGLSELAFVELVNVTLLTNSARVVFTGEENLQKIVDAVEDLGYECTVEQSGLVPSADGPITPENVQRSVMLKINGMFCKHCPPRVVDAIRSTYRDMVSLEQVPTLESPVMKVTYTPQPPNFTIRNIIKSIDTLDPSFKATFHTPPTIEQRSHAMRKHEQHRLLVRLLLSTIIAVPTLLIGVIWTSLVSASNSLRQFFERPIWSGRATRADWALFILATPVFFLAADVFHIRALKEIRALWRRRSKVPILQRFYRFGSMDLLISAGTSVAYFASIAVLGIDATANKDSSSQSSTYFDSVVFLTFFILIGRYLEAYSKAKTGNAIGMLTNLRPREAVLVTSSLEDPHSTRGSEETIEKEYPSNQWSDTKIVDAQLLEVGDVVLVSHGSSPPADGTIIGGSTKCNESSLTGESRPVPKQPGDAVYVGAVNVGDPISVRITELGGTSMLDQIVAVVREGQTKRAPVERIVDIVTGYFVPVITALAIITFVIWLTLGFSGVLSEKYLSSQQGGWAFWSLEFAIAVFVVACPCGIGLAAPTALFVGSGLAASHGILVRGGGEAFQEASNIDAIVFDKTGTLTEGGDLKVTDHEILIKDEEQSIAWSITKSLEETSSHPMAQATMRFAESRSTRSIKTMSINEQPGLGLRGTFAIEQSEMYEAALGSEALISSLSPVSGGLLESVQATLSTWKSESKSIALLAIRKVSTASPDDHTSDWTLAALFATSDPIRISTIPAITTLQDRGIPVYMLTGDNPSTASAVARTLSIPQDHVFAGVLPTEKASKIRWLQENAPRRSTSTPPWLKRIFSRKRTDDIEKGENQHKKATIAFIGDGINDAPALTTASVSISLSGASDIALHSSSFILLNSSLDTIITLFELSERVFRRVKFNFGWAVVYNVLLVPIAAGVLFRVREGGWRLGPVWGSAAMALSSLCVVGSSLVLRWEGEWGVRRLRRALGGRK